MSREAELTAMKLGAPRTWTRGKHRFPWAKEWRLGDVDKPLAIIACANIPNETTHLSMKILPNGPTADSACSLEQAKAWVEDYLFHDDPHNFFAETR